MTHVTCGSLPSTWHTIAVCTGTHMGKMMTPLFNDPPCVRPYIQHLGTHFGRACKIHVTSLPDEGKMVLGDM